MLGSDFVLTLQMDHKVNLKRGGSYIKHPKWISNQKSKRNP